MTPVRARFATGATLQVIVAADVDPALLELFLIQFSAFGVGMTEPVEGWIRRAGERCRTIGLDGLGRALEMHAGHEADHHLMMISDTRRLVDRWNARHPLQLSADELLARPAPPGVQRYRALHEQVIGGSTPFGQIAIEYEIEQLSVGHGAALMANVARRLGREALEGLSFIEEHVAIDAGHTKFNAAELDRLVTAHPDFVGALVRAGTGALESYAGFLDDCLSAARAIKQRLQP
jgi:hypothetical protein